ALGIDLVDHGRQRGGFARARRPRYQHQPTRLVAHLAYDWRQTQLVERFDLKRNQTENASRSTALVENVGAEASEALQPEREIQFEGFFKPVFLRVGHHAVGQLLGLSRRQLRQV